MVLFGSEALKCCATLSHSEQFSLTGKSSEVFVWGSQSWGTVELCSGGGGGVALRLRQ